LQFKETLMAVAAASSWLGKLAKSNAKYRCTAAPQAASYALQIAWLQQ
jgi:hypothetical protein